MSKQEEEIRRAIPCYVNRCGGFHVKREGKFGPFYGCTNYPRCTATTSDDDARDIITANVFGETDDEDCPRWDR